MLTQEQNDTLTRVGPGTPMGSLMRRYWIPALLEWEVAEPDGEPAIINLLGEELVAFRQTSATTAALAWAAPATSPCRQISRSCRLTTATPMPASATWATTTTTSAVITG